MLGQNTGHLRKGGNKRLCHFLPIEVAGSQREQCNMSGDDRSEFSRAIANPIIFGENDPSASLYFGKPDLISGILQKVIIVDFDRSSCCTQGIRYVLRAKVAVKKEDQRLMQLRGRVRTGSLLRSRSGCGHNRPLTPQSTLQLCSVAR